MRLQWKAFLAFQWAFGVQLGTTIEQLISTCIVNAAAWWGENTERIKHFLLV